jgi:hypothetical protein
MPNPILEELYATRQQLLAECQGDVHAYVLAARERALASGRAIATPRPRDSRVRDDVTSAEPESTGLKPAPAPMR